MNTSSIEDRMATLEASNRRLRTALAVAILFGSVFVVSAWQSTSGEVRTRKLVIVDASGATVASLGEGSGSRGLIVNGSDGQPRVKLLASEAVSKLTLECNLNGGKRNTEVQAATGFSGMIAGWPEGVPSAQLGLDKTKKLYFKLWDGKKMRTLLEP